MDFYEGNLNFCSTGIYAFGFVKDVMVRRILEIPIIDWGEAAGILVIWKYCAVFALFCLGS